MSLYIVDCECNQDGSVTGSYCNLGTGQCVCHENVTERNCGKCAPEHWSLSSGMGCRECTCSTFGAIDNECNEVCCYYMYMLLHVHVDC